VRVRLSRYRALVLPEDARLAFHLQHWKRARGDRLFPAICSVVNSVNIRDSTVKRRNPPRIFVLSSSFHRSATKSSIRSLLRCQFLKSCRNQALYRKRCFALVKNSALLIDNRRRSFVLRDESLGSFCKFCEAPTHPPPSVPPASTFEIALLPKAVSVHAFSFFLLFLLLVSLEPPAKRSEVANKRERSIFRPTREAGGTIQWPGDKSRSCRISRSPTLMFLLQIVSSVRRGDDATAE